MITYQVVPFSTFRSSIFLFLEDETFVLGLRLVSSRLASSGSSTVPPIEEHFMPTTKKRKKVLVIGLFHLQAHIIKTKGLDSFVIFDIYFIRVKFGFDASCTIV